jgi:hypothetical protein
VILPPELLTAIGRAVESQDGTVEDAEDLAATWERLQADKHGRVDRLRHDAAHPRCCCADGGDVPADGLRCVRCYGLIGREATR